MKIQEAFNAVVSTVSGWLSTAATYAGKAWTVISANTVHYAGKVHEFAKPYFASASQFVSENRGHVLIATAVLITSFVGYAAWSGMFSRGAAPAPAPAPVTP